MWLAYLVLFILLSPGVIFTVPMGKKIGRLGVVVVHAVIFLLVVNLLEMNEGFQQNNTFKQNYPKGLKRITPAQRSQMAQQEVKLAENRFNSAKMRYRTTLNTFNSNVLAANKVLDAMVAQLRTKNMAGNRLAQTIASPTSAPIQQDLSVAQTSSDPLITKTKELINIQTRLGNDSKNLANARKTYNNELQNLKNAQAALARIPGAVAQPVTQPVQYAPQPITQSAPQPEPQYAYSMEPEGGLTPEMGSSGGIFGVVADISSKINGACAEGEYKVTTTGGSKVCTPCSSGAQPTGDVNLDAENTNSMLSSCI